MPLREPCNGLIYGAQLLTVRLPRGLDDLIGHLYICRQLYADHILIIYWLYTWQLPLYSWVHPVAATRIWLKHPTLYAHLPQLVNTNIPNHRIGWTHRCRRSLQSYFSRLCDNGNDKLAVIDLSIRAIVIMNVNAMTVTNMIIRSVITNMTLQWYIYNYTITHTITLTTINLSSHRFNSNRPPRCPPDSLHTEPVHLANRISTEINGI